MAEGGGGENDGDDEARGGGRRGWEEEGEPFHYSLSCPKKTQQHQKSFKGALRRTSLRPQCSEHSVMQETTSTKRAPQALSQCPQSLRYYSNVVIYP